MTWCDCVRAGIASWRWRRWRRARAKQFFFKGIIFFSTMPVSELVRSLDAHVPPAVQEISDGLVYRDFITVGLLLSELKIKDEGGQKLIEDNWIYVQEPDVQVGRLQIFNNWSPFLVADPETVWVGMEYFAEEDDELWRLPDDAIAELALDELCALGLIDRDDVADTTVLR